MKRRNLKIITLLLTIVALVFAACVDEPDERNIQTDKYYYDIPDVPVEEDYVVGALYEEINMGYWYKYQNNQPLYDQPQLYTGTPLLGDPAQGGKYYMAQDYFIPLGADNDILGKQLAYGRRAGIDFFLVNWNGHGTDTLFLNWRHKWKPGDPKIAFVFDCNHLYADKFGKQYADSLHKEVIFPGTGKYVGPYQDNRSTKKTFLDQLDSLKTYFFSEEFYYKLPDGKPLLGLNNYRRTNSITGTVNDIRDKIGSVYLITPTINDDNGWTSLRSLQNVNNPLMMPDNTYKEIYIFRENGEKNGAAQMPFDAVYQPSMLTDNFNVHGYDNWRRNFFSGIDINYKEWKSLLEQQGKEFIPSVMPAFDNRANDSTSHIFLQPRESDGVLYKTYANVGKRNVGKYRMVLINSWNNFRQGSNLEPTKESGEAYLDFTKQYFKKPE